MSEQVILAIRELLVLVGACFLAYQIGKIFQLAVDKIYQKEVRHGN